MSWQLLILILVSVTISAVAQITLKYGMSVSTVQQGISGGGINAVISVVGSLFVWLGFVLYFLGAVLWLGVLARIDVGQAYPFVGLGFLLTMAFGVLVLGEVFSVVRLLGTLLVIVGVVLAARG